MARGHRFPGWLSSLLLGAAMLAPVGAPAYEPEVHQRLTFHAARWFNRCVEGTEVPPLTPLEVRIIANSNMGLANTSALRRFFRWSYFDPAADRDRRWLWIVNTRFTDHYQNLLAELSESVDDTERYRELGRIVSYVQLASAPSRAIPVYAARFWRWSFTDRFEHYRVNDLALQAVADQDCAFLDDPPDDFRAVLDDMAADTVLAVRGPMEGMPATWEAFWRPRGGTGEFGEYGPAGNNFGRAVEFPCGGGGSERCVLVDDDPLYTEFALGRQIAAVRATARAMWLMQVRYGSVGAPWTGGASTDAE
jgi:hypothetical protein